MENLAIENTDNNNNDKKSNIVVNQKSNFRRGSVELMVLYLLSQKDCYGYQLTQLIEELTDGVICIPIGSLYPALYKLIDAGYISDDKRLVGKRMERVYYQQQQPLYRPYLLIIQPKKKRADARKTKQSTRSV